MVQQLDAGFETRRASARPRRWIQAIGTAACTAVVIAGPASMAPSVKVTLILLGTAGAIDLSRREARNPGDPRPIAWTIAGLFTLAVAMTPRFATDIWSYTMIGRLVTAHHFNPYRVAPAAVRADPLLHLIPPAWRNGTTPYGPLFVLHTALISVVAGTHPLLYRLAFQATAAAAVGAALVLLWRATRSTAALALIGLHPEIAGSIVNAGHNDAIVALGLLSVVLLLARGHLRGAAWVLVASLLVKLTIAYAIIPIMVWTVARHGPRSLRAFVIPAVVGAAIMLFIPGAIGSTANVSGIVITRLSVWNLPLHVSWLAIPGLTAANYVTVGLLATAGLIALVAARERGRSDAGRGAALGAAAWVTAAGYVLAWYSVLGFVTAALRPTGRLARWFALQAGVITAIYMIPRRSLRTSALTGATVHVWIPIVLTAAFVWALSERRTSPIPTA